MGQILLDLSSDAIARAIEENATQGITNWTA
jgi:hypothetical protein